MLCYELTDREANIVVRAISRTAIERKTPLATRSHIVTSCGSEFTADQAYVIQLLSRGEGGYRKGHIVRVARNAKSAREFLDRWYANDGPAAKTHKVCWLKPHFTKEEIFIG